MTHGGSPFVSMHGGFPTVRSQMYENERRGLMNVNFDSDRHLETLKLRRSYVPVKIRLQYALPIATRER